MIIKARLWLIIIIEENKIIKTKTSLIRLIIVKIKERPLAVSDKTELIRVLGLFL